MEDAVLTVGIADIKIGKAPQMIKTNLGSCVAVCLYARELRCGGMLHFMMAKQPGTGGEILKKAKYAETGIPALLNELRIHFGAHPEALTAKLFGGANLLPGITRNIGLENEAMAREILKQSGIKVAISCTGGQKGYKIDFDLSTGKVLCQVFGQAPQEY